MLLAVTPLRHPHANVIGASSGGVSALLELVAGLPGDVPAVVGVVLHVGGQPSVLPDLLGSRGPLSAVHAEHGQALRAGTTSYVAPPDQHPATGWGRSRTSAPPEPTASTRT